jgi:hypothetical protein
VSRDCRKSRTHNHRRSRSRSRSNRHHHSRPSERRYKSRSRSPKPTQRKIVIDRKNLIIPYVNDKISICCHGQKCHYFKMKICHFMHPSQIETCLDIYEDTGNMMLTINKAKEFKDFAINNREKNPNFKKYFRV